MPNKNVLYLSYDGMTDPLGQSQVLPYIQSLSKAGYSFTLISFEKKDKYLQNKEIIKEICRNSNIDWVPLKYTKKPPIFSTLWDILKLYLKVKSEHRKKKFSLIHCRSYVTSLVGLRMKRKKNVKFLFDMRGFWADERVDGNIWNLENKTFQKVYNFFKSKEREFLEEADQVISLTHAAKHEMLQWNVPYLTADKIEVIPCVADYNLFQAKTPESHKKAKERFGFAEDDFVILYLGSLGTWYMLDEMLHFFEALKIKKPNAKFLFLTGHDKEEILLAARKRNIKEEDIVVSFAQRNELNQMAHAANFGIFFIKPAYSKMASSPTKMGELLAMGIPIISIFDLGDTAIFLKETNSGVIINGFERPGIFQQINEIIRSEYDAEKLRENSRQVFELTVGAEKYKKCYDGLTK